MGKAFLITGTDTGIGKTFIGRCLIRYFTEINLRVVPFKPIETGVFNDQPEDGLTLLKEAKIEEDLDRVVPYRFELPASPLVASRKEGKPIDLTRIVETFNQLKSRYDLVMVEGAGGICVPITQSITYLELAKILNIPAVVIARSKLGTINHTLLTVRIAKTYGIRIIAVILNQYEGLDYVEKTNPKVIEELENIKTFVVEALKEPKPLKEIGEYILANI